MLRNRVSLFVLSTCVAGCSVTGLNLKEGIESFQVQNYRQAFIRLKPEAEKGIPDAEYAVGYMYYYGQGVVEDREKACGWITRAAAHSQSDAILALKRIQGKVPVGRCRV